MNDLPSIIRAAAKSGRLNHISVGFIDGKWSASYRGVEDRDGRVFAHSDAVDALIGAITGRKIPEPVIQKPKKTKPVEDDLL